MLSFRLKDIVHVKLIICFGRFTAATITEITYGHTVTSSNDPYIRMADEAAGATVEAGSPASMLVDFIPICGCSHCFESSSSN